MTVGDVIWPLAVGLPVWYLLVWILCRLLRPRLAPSRLAGQIGYYDLAAGSRPSETAVLIVFEESLRRSRVRRGLEED